MIEINKVTKSYGNGAPALKNLNIEIDDECKPWEYWIDLDLKILVPTHTIPDEYHGTITYTLYEN